MLVNDSTQRNLAGGDWTEEQRETFRDFTKKFVALQLDTVTLSPVRKNESHLRRLMNVYLILKYPSDHWEAKADAIRWTVEECMLHLPSFMIEKYLPPDYQDVVVGTLHRK